MHHPRSSGVFDAIAALETPEECRPFLGELLSPDEMEALAKRWEILLLRVQGLTYQDIKARINTSNETISRGSRMLNSESFCRCVIERFRLRSS